MKRLPIFFFLLLVASLAKAQSPATTQRLSVLRGAYEAAWRKEVDAPHQQSVADLDAKYKSALERALAAATQAGQLDTALALRDEMKRLQEARPLPADDFSAPETLKTLRLTYRSALASLEVKRDQTATPVKARYDAALEALQTELTKAADLDGAVAVKNLREGLKTGTAPAAPQPPAPTPGPQRSSAPVAVAGSEKEAAARLAEWAFACRGSVFIILRGQDQPMEVKNAADLPADGWRLHTIAAGGYNLDAPAVFPWELLPSVPGLAALSVNQKQPFTPENASCLGTLKGLQKLDIANLELTLDALKAMPVFAGMNHLRMGRLTGSAEEGLRLIGEKFPGLPILELGFEVPAAQLPGPKHPLFMLKELCLSGPLSPEIIAKLADMPELKAFETKDCRAASLPADLLFPLKDYRYLKLRRCLAVADLLPAMEEFEKLDLLLISLSSTDTLTAADLEKLAGLKSRRFDLDGGLGKKIGDEHIDALMKMKGVKEMSLMGHQISQAGLARLRKALPACKIRA